MLCGPVCCHSAIVICPTPISTFDISSFIPLFSISRYILFPFPRSALIFPRLFYTGWHPKDRANGPESKLKTREKHEGVGIESNPREVPSRAEKENPMSIECFYSFTFKAFTNFSLSRCRIAVCMSVSRPFSPVSLRLPPPSISPSLSKVLSPNIPFRVIADS